MELEQVWGEEGTRMCWGAVHPTAKCCHSSGARNAPVYEEEGYRAGDQPRRQELITEINMLGRNNWNWISLKEEIIDVERKYTPVNPMVLH